MQAQTQQADDKSLEYIKNGLIGRYAYSADEASRLVKKYNYSINVWYTDFVNQVPQHRGIDDVVIDIHFDENFHY